MCPRPPIRIRSILAVALLCPATVMALPAAHPAQAALASVQGFLDAMARHDPAGMRAHVLPTGSMALMRHGKPVQLSLGDFIGRLKPDGHRVAEYIRHPLVRVDHDVAIVWAPYRFLLDGKLHHCGTDAFSMVRVDGHWLIASVADTSRATCAGG
ncbi:nuclear transport factor 2 family protein [Dyella sp. A6]|uniref:nuclear transport factor 2 family protein n=1 Tax=Dyella aluminiiresistens TaxID=3069105 RepID=UPI002E75C01E|nr:nuclear transport factor 2 family protein [Dyella sp. A6]